jgi:hypothetical protein
MGVVSLVFIPPRILRRVTLGRPHPFEKGRGGWGCILTCEGAMMVEVEPTSLNTRTCGRETFLIL